MKRLLLLRHAQAEPALAGESDFDRVLTRRGAEDAADMARRLKAQKATVNYLLSSSAPRAYATAEIFAHALKIAPNHIDKDDRLYTASPNDLLKITRECDDRHAHLLIVAHNPSITEFADKLSGERRIDAMPTCAVVTLQFAIKSWRDINWHHGVAVELDYPAHTS